MDTCAPRHGATISRDSHVQCCVQTEARGCQGNRLRRGPDTPNHKSGPLDEDSSGRRREWGPHPWWVRRAQGCAHPALGFGCTLRGASVPADVCRPCGPLSQLRPLPGESPYWTWLVERRKCV